VRIDIHYDLIFKRLETQQALGKFRLQVAAEAPIPIKGDVISFNGEDDPSFTIITRQFVYGQDSLDLYIRAKED
jgi:hypothetical protein